MTAAESITRGIVDMPRYRRQPTFELAIGHTNQLPPAAFWRAVRSLGTPEGPCAAALYGMFRTPGPGQ